MNLRHRRIQYETNGFDRQDAAESPIEQWHRWYDEAEEAGLPEPHAMVLGTIGLDGGPDSRVVLARGVDDAGITFFGNYESAKGQQLLENAAASALFPWLGLHRQVRVRGAVRRMSATDSDEYFASRPRESQIGAWASPQSRVIENRDELDVSVAEFTERFADAIVPRPPHWGGWILEPETFEFWQGRPNRLHDRLLYRRILGSEPSTWAIERLAP